MKLASVLCLAALSITGCATDDETTGGAFLAGLRPSKPSLDNPNDSELPQNPTNTGNIGTRGMIDIGDIRTGGFAETIKDGHWPLPNNVCDGCEVTLVTVDQVGADDGSIGEIDVVNDGGNRICKIFLQPDGGFDTTDCVR